MKYKLIVNKIKIVNKELNIFIKGEFLGENINSSCLSVPRVILYFNNGIEDRRIYIPIKPENLILKDGKCEFNAQYKIPLKSVFWKTRDNKSPFNIYFNLQFRRFYKEKVKFVFHNNLETDKKFFLLEKAENYFIVKSVNDKESKFKFLKTLKEFIKEWVAVTYLPKYIKYCAKYKKVPIGISKEEILTGLGINITEYKSSLIKLKYKLNKFRKVKANKVLFYSTRTKEISGNFKFVHNQIKKDKNLNIKFLFGTRTIKNMTMKEINKVAKECATSKVIIIDEVTPPLYLIELKKETKLIQLWHACGAFKTFGFSRLGKPNEPSAFSTIHRSYDYAIVSSEHCKKYYSEGFGISTSNIIATGIPRTDIFFDKKHKTKVKNNFYKKYPHLKNKKIILFVPTFRSQYTQTAFYPMKMFAVKDVCDYLGDEYAIIIKHHPFVTRKHYIPAKYADRVIDLSTSTEINDLLFISDLVITDYSSIVFECSILNLPMLFYAFDLKNYIDKRDFYFDYQKCIPGKICTDIDTLLKTIKKGYNGSQKNEEFKAKFFDHLDGHSSQRVANLIYKALNEK